MREEVEKVRRWCSEDLGRAYSLSKLATFSHKFCNVEAQNTHNRRIHSLNNESVHLHPSVYKTICILYLYLSI